MMLVYFDANDGDTKQTSFTKNKSHSLSNVSMITYVLVRPEVRPSRLVINLDHGMSTKMRAVVRRFYLHDLATPSRRSVDTC